MRIIEIVGALILAAVVFVAVKLLGLVLQFAFVAAVLGFALGFIIMRSLRSAANP